MDGRTAEESVQSSAALSSDKTPEEYADVIKISNKFDIEPSIADRHFDRLTKKFVVEKENYDEIVRESPALGKWLTTPEHVTIARNDMAKLAALTEAAASQPGIVKTYANQLLSGIYELNSLAWTTKAVVGKWDGLLFVPMLGPLGPIVSEKLFSPSNEEIAENINYFQAKKQNLRRKMPNWVHKFDEGLETRSKNVDKEWDRITNTAANELWKGNITQALKEYSGGTAIVAETLALIGHAGVHPIATVGKGIEMLPYSWPVLRWAAGPWR